MAAGLNRRQAMAAGLAAAGQLVIGIPLVSAAPAAGPTDAQSFAPNALLRIDREGAVTLTVPYAEMGQGTLTAMTMLIAEELEVSPGSIRTLHAPGDDQLYPNPALGEQMTGGSTTVRAAWRQMRLAGAAARVMLVEAAARQWGAKEQDCTARDGEVLHTASGRRAGYGALVAAAARLPVPKAPPLKAGDFSVIGKDVRRIDSKAKTEGSAVFGLDVRRPGMLYASVTACPVIGGRLAAVDESPALAVRDVTQVVRLPDAVAVIARHTGAARKGLTALEPCWTGGDSGLSTPDLIRQCDAALDEPGVLAVVKGDTTKAMAAAPGRFEATYRLPMLAHAAMEPLGCTVEVGSDGCELWLGSQVPGRARREVAKALGLAVEKVRVNNHLIGGGFGRRLQSEWVVQAALIARQVQAPLKVVWSREEDMRQGSYRFLNHSRLRIGLDAAGMPVAWEHRVVGPSVMAWFLPAAYKDGVDFDAVNGAAGPYVLTNVAIDYVRNDPPKGLLAGNWRGVGETRNAFIVETAIDELAARAGIDPIAYRRRLLPPDTRLRGVLDRLVASTKWGAPPGKGKARGVSVLSAFGSHVGLVAEVVGRDDGTVSVTRLTCVIDCGIAVNPTIVRQQIEGGLMYGLGAVYYGEITIAEGRIEQSNFHDYPVLRIVDAPEIEVIVMDSKESPGGVGEPGTAVVAPAVVNAVAALTGKRLRSLPLPAEMVQRV